MQNKLAIIGGILLAAIVGYSFVFVGSPEHQRQIRQDKEKIQDIKRLSCVVENYFYDHGEVPPGMERIKSYHAQMTKVVNQRRNHNRCYCYMSRDMDFVDMQDQPYEYVPSADPTDGTYQLCAVFNLDAEELRKNSYVYDKWAKQFKPGRHCFNMILHECEKGE